METTAAFDRDHSWHLTEAHYPSKAPLYESTDPITDLLLRLASPLPILKTPRAAEPPRAGLNWTGQTTLARSIDRDIFHIRKASPKCNWGAARGASMRRCVAPTRRQGEKWREVDQKSSRSRRCIKINISMHFVFRVLRSLSPSFSF